MFIYILTDEPLARLIESSIAPIKEGVAMTILYEHPENGMTIVDENPKFTPTQRPNHWTSGEESGTSVVGTIDNILYRKTEIDGCDIIRFDLVKEPIKARKIEEFVENPSPPIKEMIIPAMNIDGNFTYFDACSALVLSLRKDSTYTIKYRVDWGANVGRSRGYTNYIVDNIKKEKVIDYIEEPTYRVNGTPVYRHVINKYQVLEFLNS